MTYWQTVVAGALVASATLAACGPAGGGPGDGGDAGGDAMADSGSPAVVVRTVPAEGAALALSEDDHIAVAANRTAGNVAVFAVGTPQGSMGASLRRTALIPFAPDAEPWAAVIANDGTTAYVILRKAQQLVKIADLRSTPRVQSTLDTGSEPTGLALTPNGTRLYVANWGDGTVTVVDPAAMTVVGTVDLNVTLAASGMLGPVAPRPSLAHPRAITITNDGDTDDADETVYVTEFFAQARDFVAPPTDDTRWDVDRQGVVYRFDTAANTTGVPIVLAPVGDTGFNDALGHPTGCFPNQLAAATIDNGRLYVSAMCASPRGPTGPAPAGTDPAHEGDNFKTEVHPSLFVVDVTTNAERQAERVVLTRAFQDFYDQTRNTGDGPTDNGFICDGARPRMPLLPEALAFVPGTHELYVAAYGADALFRVAFRADGSLAAVGSGATTPYVNLAFDAELAGRLPVGVAISHHGGAFALALNENTRNVSAVDLGAQLVTGAVASADPPAPGIEYERNAGRRFFVTGVSRWSYRNQGWNSCESCHPDGLADSVTWFFPRGPRQTPALSGSYGPNDTRRMLTWGATFDEIQDLEMITRRNQGGVGAVVYTNGAPSLNATPGVNDRIVVDGTTPVAGQLATATRQDFLNGAMADIADPSSTAPVHSELPYYKYVDEYVQSIRSPRARQRLADAERQDVAAGAALFQSMHCAACHGGDLWSAGQRFYTPSEANNNPMTGLLRSQTYTLPAGFPTALNPPAAAGPATLRYADLATAGANDQINCVLRAVGTFPATLGAGQAGVAPPGVVIREVRQDMTTPAQGATGFNPPALLAALTGAPYYHAGNARTLEEVFDPTFAPHHDAFGPTLPAPTDPTRARLVRQLVAFLLSIDDDTPTVPTTQASADLGFAVDLCPAMP